MKKNKRQFSDYEDYLKQELKDPELAQEYLNIALDEYYKDNNLNALLLALKDVAMAMGGIQKLSRQTKLNRQNLYRIFSAQSDPKINTFGSILNGLGFQLAIKKMFEPANMRV